MATMMRVTGLHPTPGAQPPPCRVSVDRSYLGDINVSRPG